MTWTVGLIDFSGDSEVQSDGRCVSRYKRTYLVLTDAATWQSEAAVAAAVGINRGSALADDPNAICHKASIGPGPVMTRAPHLAYTATYEFSTDATSPDSVDDDPTTRRTIWSIAPTIQSTYIIKDRNGKLILNTAGQPFDGGIPVDARMGTVTATRNKDAAGYDKNAVLSNSGKLNSSTFLGGDEGTVQVDISATETYEGAFHFWKETYTFAYNDKGWQPQPVSAGYRQRLTADESSNDYHKIVQITGSDLGDTSATAHDPINEPEPLDEDGVVVQVSDRPDGCHIIEVDYFDKMDFNSFEL